VFELRIALKYLIPNLRSLSTALISFLSVGVVAVVVWLVLVFLSVTEGMEKSWVSKLTSLYGPLRVSPTDAYYRSYYYHIDSYASASNHTLKTIGEKAIAPLSDPYLASEDMEISSLWTKADRDTTGALIDPVKTAIALLKKAETSFPGLKYQDYEISGALLKLELVRDGRSTHLSQMSFLLSAQEENPHFAKLLIEGSPLLAENEVLLPKSYQTSGAKVGDKGVLSYSMPSAAISQEQRIPIRVAGFYDPGLLSLGSRCLIVSNHITRQISLAMQTYSPDGMPTNGIFVWPKEIGQLESLSATLIRSFQEAHIDPYWKITTYENYEFSKDLLQQFRSDRTLFSLIGAIILFVACCNIVSLLILLVNDKRREIAIMQSMGAKRSSIITIFALCGVAMGLLSCLFGTLLAIVTLHNLDSLVAMLSAIQGRAALNPLFFGPQLPKELSSLALLFVLIATPLLSFVAALIPAWKASKIRAPAVLRSE
jgi:lipoprotein-releasing system permease protein